MMLNMENANDVKIYETDFQMQNLNIMSGDLINEH